jgi:hypothetical protein
MTRWSSPPVSESKVGHRVRQTPEGRGLSHTCPFGSHTTGENNEEDEEEPSDEDEDEQDWEEIDIASMDPIHQAAWRGDGAAVERLVKEDRSRLDAHN